MAYAVVAWRTDGDPAEVAKAFKPIGVIDLFPGLFVVDEDGVDWNEVKRKVEDVVARHPGTEAVILAPSKATRVGCWVHDSPSAADLKKLKRTMNRSGSEAIPPFYATPPLP
jgi:hypothetical protein